MDSGNSGSLQSSSGGDEEFDSRATTISPLMTNSTSHVHLGPTSQPLISTQIAMFDAPSNYLRIQNPTPLFNPNTTGSKTLRCDQNIIHPMPSSSPFVNSFTNNTVELPTQPAAASGPYDHNHNHNHQSARNPKKRSRASRRAPTTVLTTDTTNFRAMVQEFTGIPSPPFSSAVRSSSLGGSQPPYLLQPFPHKLHQPPPPPPFLSSASSSFLSPAQSSNLFASLLESTMRFPIGYSKAQDHPLELVSSNDPHIKMGNLDEFAASPIDGNYYNLSTNYMTGKMNNLHGQKETENVATKRGEGMVESWLCSSSE